MSYVHTLLGPGRATHTRTLRRRPREARGVGVHSTNNTTNVRDAVPKRGNGMTVALR